MNTVANLLHALVDFVLPQDCILCDQETPHSLLCDTCFEYLPIVRPPICCRCGRPIELNGVCAYCHDHCLLDHGRAWLCFVPPVNTLIHHFKYRKKTILATLLGRAMASIILADGVLQQADMIVPIPLFWFKRFNRGYNQSSLLCNVISANTGLPQHPALKRNRYTQTQTKLSETARQRNIKGAFSIISDRIEDKRIILVDDVMTTGATMNECARVLKQAGAAAIYSCVAAITP